MRGMAWPRVLPLSIGVVLACGGGGSAGVTGLSANPDPPAETTEGSGTASSTGGSTGSSTSSEGEGGAGSGSSSTGMSFDMGASPDFGPVTPAGCKGKIDLLFVISRDSLMDVQQEKLVADFPGFIAVIEDVFAELDYHIMVIDGDQGWGSDLCNEGCEPEGCEDFPCELLDTVKACDEAIGAGTIFNAGRLAANKPCGLAADKRYLTKGQPKLAETFSCLAQVGTSGSAQMIEALVASLSPKLRSGCNKGFLRDDAVLFVTFVRDTYDSLEGVPYEWHLQIREAKGGDDNAIVLLDIGAFADLAACEASNEPLCGLMKLFPYKAFVDNDSPTYVPGFAEATKLVAKACADFVPG